MNFFTVMLKCKAAIYEKRSRLSAEAFKKVQYFVENENYSSCKRANEMAKLIFTGYSDEDTLADYFGVAVRTIQSQKKTISKELWKIFPKDFFEKLVNYADNREYIESIVNSIKYYKLSSKDVVFSDVIRCVRNTNLSSEGDVSYVISEVSNEIDFLLRYSYEFLKNDLKSVDLDKLKYLLDVLDGSDLRAKSEILERLGISNE